MLRLRAAQIYENATEPEDERWKCSGLDLGLESKQLVVLDDLLLGPLGGR